MIDYLQLMQGDSRTDNRVQEVSYISRNLKTLARELNVPVLAAAQLSRAVEQRADKRPVLSDLRESGSLEQDADIVMFIYREDKDDEESLMKNVAEIIVSKHRNGPTGSVQLVFREQLAQFVDAATYQFDQGNQGVCAMGSFNGFSSKGSPVEIPANFFTELLPKIKNLHALKILLLAFHNGRSERKTRSAISSHTDVPRSISPKINTAFWQGLNSLSNRTGCLDLDDSHCRQSNPDLPAQYTQKRRRNRSHPAREDHPHQTGD